MTTIPNNYNTKDFLDLTNAWKELVAVADGASEEEIYSLAEGVLKKINKPVTKENLDIIIRTLSSQIKLNISDN